MYFHEEISKRIGILKLEPIVLTKSAKVKMAILAIVHRKRNNFVSRFCTFYHVLGTMGKKKTEFPAEKTSNLAESSHFRSFSKNPEKIREKSGKYLGKISLFFPAYLFFPGNLFSPADFTLS